MTTSFFRSLRIVCTGLLLASPLSAQTSSNLRQEVQQIVERAEYQHAIFGIEILSLDTGKVIYALNADKLFTPGSTTKLLTEGAALGLLGPDYRFRTCIYRTGPILPNGTLDGDLVLVASGDPNLSGRIQPDGTLAFENEDHAYAGLLAGARAVAGDPLLVIHELAQQVANQHIKRINGRVLVDVTLFPEGGKEPGSGAVVSPIAVNDNIVDVILTSGKADGSPTTLQALPATSYVRFVNKVTTGAPTSDWGVDFASDTASPNGIRTVTVEGSLPAGKAPTLLAYKVPQPSRFTQVLLTEALLERGIVIGDDSETKQTDFGALAASYRPINIVAEHVSPPLKEEVKITLKVSQNLHATMMPYILGAVLRAKDDDRSQAGLDLEHQFLLKAGLDLMAAAQSDGAGGGAAAFTPDFMCRYLQYMEKQSYFTAFLNALPVFGRDGTLWNVLVNSPAAGHVAAKTGTNVLYNGLGRNLIVVGKGLVGYITTAGGRRLAFAAFINHVSVGSNLDSVEKVGIDLAEVAATAYQYAP
jgi:PBP4 family serine-type D-alanyl-D-alanine carboxypeptidase